MRRLIPLLLLLMALVAVPGTVSASNSGVQLYARSGGNYLVYHGPSLPCVEAVAPIAGTLDNTTGIWFYVNRTGKWLAWSPVAPEWACDLKLLEGGQIYWLRVTQDTWWQFKEDDR